MPAAESKRGIGLWSAGALVVANMIGAGVFTTSGFALDGLAPQHVLWAWVVGGVLALFGALSYAGLAHAMPESGGEYHYLARTLHPLAGFLAGWISLLAGFTAPIAVSALALQAYLAPALDVSADKRWIGTVAIALAFGMHGLRRSHGVVLQNAAVALKFVLLVGFVIVGAVLLPATDTLAPAGRGSSEFDLGAFAETLVWISFAYSGWNAAVYIAGEVRDPRRNATRALWLGCLLVTGLYVALNTVFLYSAPVDQLVGRPDIGAAAARALGGDWLWRGTSAIVAIALFTSISAMTMAGPRVYVRMAEDGVFPRGMATAGRAPLAATALQAALAIVVVWWAGLAELLGYIGFTLGLSTAAAVVGLMRLRRRAGAAAVPVTGYPIVPAVYIVMTLAAAGFLVDRQPASAFYGLGTIALGVPLYYILRRDTPHRTTGPES